MASTIFCREVGLGRSRVNGSKEKQNDLCKNFKDYKRVGVMFKILRSSACTNSSDLSHRPSLSVPARSWAEQESWDRIPETQAFAKCWEEDKRNERDCSRHCSLSHPSQGLPTVGGETGGTAETPLRTRCPQPEGLSQTNLLIPFLALWAFSWILFSAIQRWGQGRRAEKLLLNHRKPEGRTE